MLPLLLAAALAGPLPPLPANVEASCAPGSPRLARMPYAPADQIPKLQTQLDGEIAAVLTEERRLPPAPVESPWLLPIAALLAVAALSLALAAGRRRGLTGALALSLLGCAFALSIAAERDHRRERARAARGAELSACHLRLVETRASLVQSRLARCANDLGETDEDIMGWISRLKTGAPLPVTELEKTHREIGPR